MSCASPSTQFDIGILENFLILCGIQDDKYQELLTGLSQTTRVCNDGFCREEIRGVEAEEASQ